VQQVATMNAELELQLRASKARLSRAAERCMNPTDAVAPSVAYEAMREVSSIQAMMKAKSVECAADGCHTLTLGQYCTNHRPPAPVGPWAIAADVFKGER
jgi:hypothetical protein